MAGFITHQSPITHQAIKIPPLLALSALGGRHPQIAQLCSNNNHLRRSVASAEIDMSGTNNLKSAAADIMCCACCGIAEGDDIKLKTCTACKSARYCSVKCQKDHRRKHKKQCRKRAAELRQDILFKQPESSHLGDCPICCLPLSFEGKYSTMMACCSKIICNGCVHANQMREAAESSVPKHKCPFCRHPLPKTQEG